MLTKRLLPIFTLIVASFVVALQSPAVAAPNFKAPFPCGQRWTYSHHSAEVRLALDFRI